MRKRMNSLRLDQVYAWTIYGLSSRKETSRHLSTNGFCLKFFNAQDFQQFFSATISVMDQM